MCILYNLQIYTFNIKIDLYHATLYFALFQEFLHKANSVLNCTCYANTGGALCMCVYVCVYVCDNRG